MSGVEVPPGQGLEDLSRQIPFPTPETEHVPPTGGGGGGGVFETQQPIGPPPGHTPLKYVPS